VKRAQLAWIAYDVASSGYVLLITAVAFPIYFRQFGTEGAAWSEALWGTLLAVSGMTAAVLAPLVGTAADITSSRLRYLLAATLLCSACTVALATPGLSLASLSGFFVVSYIAYLIAANLYDSVLKSIAGTGNASWLSGLGWGLGYVGGIACYLISTGINQSRPESSDQSEFAATFLIVGLFYAVLGTPAVMLMQDRPAAAITPTRAPIFRLATRRIGRTLGRWRNGGKLPALVIGSGLVTGSVTALTLFTPLILSNHFGLPTPKVAFLSALFSLVSIPATIAASLLVLRVSPMRLLMALSPVWVAVVLLLGFGSGWHAGLALATCLGLVVGPTNSTTRGLVANSVRERKAGEMFGYAALVNRLTAALGPLFFGLLASASSGRLIPVLVAGAVLVVGLLALPRLPVATETSR